MCGCMGGERGLGDRLGKGAGFAARAALALFRDAWCPIAARSTAHQQAFTTPSQQSPTFYTR